jgi:ribosomal protein S18 acetylase RimI-like enzyme
LSDPVAATSCGILAHPNVEGPDVLVEDPAPLLELFARDREVHPYGIADVEQLWEVSRWWQDGEAAVGAMDLPGSPLQVLYAVSARDPEGTLGLLDRLDRAGHLPERFIVTGPRGLADRLATRRDPRWSKHYEKMALRDPGRLPDAEPAVAVLDRTHLPALERLYADDPTAGDFFHPALLDTGCYLGILEDGEVLASAGIHVLDRHNGVAALGNVATRADRRGQGLGRLVTATLCHRLLTEVEVIGLNVSVGNHAAHALYGRLGFVSVLPYEEAELGAGRSADPPRR